MISALLSIALAQAPGSSMTLTQALDLADKNHVDVQLAQLSLQQAAQDEKGSYAGILPRVDLAASVSRSYSTSSQPVIIGNSFQEVSGFGPTNWFLQVAATQNLYDGGKWWTRIAKGHTDREAAEAQLAEARLQAHVSVAHLFFELVRAQRSLQILGVNVQRSQEQVDRAKALFEAGRGPKSDVYAAQVNLANDQIAVAQQKAKVDLARNSLNIAIGLAPEQELSPEPPDLAAKPAPVKAAEADQQALQGRPGLLALRKQIQSAGQSKEIARGDYFPSVNAQLGYVRGPRNFGSVVNNPADDFAAQGSINLQWNLFQGRTTDVAVQKANLAAQQAQVQLEKSERAVREETERATRTLSEGLEALDLAQQAHEAATQGMQLAQERFRAGAASNLEVRDAQLKLTSAELNLVSTQIDVQLAKVDVQAATGQL